MLTSDRLTYSKSHIDTKHTKHVPLDQFVDAIEYDHPPKHHRHSPEASVGAAGSAPINVPSVGGSAHHGQGGGGLSAAGGSSSADRFTHSDSAGQGGVPSSFGAASLASEGASSAFSIVSHATATGVIPQHTFKIITTQRPFLLSAPSEEEEIQWLSAVRALIARR